MSFNLSKISDTADEIITGPREGDMHTETLPVSSSTNPVPESQVQESEPSTANDFVGFSNLQIYNLSHGT